MSTDQTEPSASWSAQPWFRPVVFIGIFVVLVVLLFSCGRGNDPREFLDEHYEKSRYDGSGNAGAVRYTDSDSPEHVVNEIIDGTQPDDTRTGEVSEPATSGSTLTGETDPTAESTPATFLRYDSDWMVVVSSDGQGGSEIEVDDFDSSYNHYSGSGGGGVYFFGWSSFRGGGSGYGK